MKRYSKKGLWSLFLICAFPLHVWTIILAFRDFSWVAERTNSWDAVGVVSYGLIFALVESVVVFLVAILLGFLVSKRWNEERRITLMGTLVVLTSVWAIVNYLYFMLGWSLPGETILFMARLAHPLRFVYAVTLAVAGISIVVPVYFVLRSEKFFTGMQGFFERLSLLTQFYLVFDIIGLVIVVYRNV